MAQPKQYIEPKHIIKPDKIDDNHEQLQANIIDEVQNLKIKTRKLKDSLTNNEHLIIFIHGFNNSELQMHERSAYLDQKFGTDQVITTAFNWGSYCSVIQYWKDQKAATKCAKYFALFMEEIRKSDIHEFKQVDIVAHSMGNHILVQTIMHCYEKEKLHIFGQCNIIAVAPDAEKEEYRAAVKHLVNVESPIISSWFHYWNTRDGALFASKFANMKKFKLSVRAGSGHCNIGSEKFKSIQWEKESFLNHGYVGNILDKDHEFKADLFRRLKLKMQVEDDEKQQDNDVRILFLYLYILYI